jgi:hypothetical protein
MPAEYHRSRRRGEQPRKRTSGMQLFLLAEEMEEGRRVYHRHASMQRVERSQAAQRWCRTRRRVGDRERRYNFEVLRVEDISGHEGYRVCLLRRPEELMPEVREICKIGIVKMSWRG